MAMDWSAAVFDTDVFIKNVRDIPQLWKKNTKGFVDKDMKSRNWYRIGALMNPLTWPSWNDEKQKSFVLYMKNRWKNLRDCYMKLSKNPTPRKHSRHYKALRFLNANITRSRPLDNRPEINCNHILRVELEEEDEPPIVPKIEDVDLESTIDVHDSYPFPVFTQNGEVQRTEIEHHANEQSMTGRNIYERNIYGEKVNEQEAKTTNSHRFDDVANLSFAENVNDLSINDPEVAFLMSLVPDFKRLSYEDKVEFRFQNIMFFRDILHRNQNASTSGK